MSERGDIIAATMALTNEFIDATFARRNECVFGTEIMRRALARQGIGTKRLPVRVLIADPEAWESCGHSIINLMAGRAQGRVAILGKADHEFPGHVVLTSRNPDLLIDPTLDQGNALLEGADLEPLIHEVSRTDLRAFERSEGALGAHLDDGWGLAWVPAPDIDLRRALGYEDAQVRDFFRMGGPFDRAVLPKLVPKRRERA
jgi:hypothetical protein